jgi:hypothetical protein
LSSPSPMSLRQVRRGIDGCDGTGHSHLQNAAEDPSCQILLIGSRFTTKLPKTDLTSVDDGMPHQENPNMLTITKQPIYSELNSAPILLLVLLSLVFFP